MGQERPPIVFYAFDLLRLDGKDLRNLPIEERKAKLAAELRS
jgi:bifunctional non-homologous end joining protein LigD